MVTVKRILNAPLSSLFLVALFFAVVMSLVVWASGASPCGNVAHAQTASCPVASDSIFEGSIGLQDGTVNTLTFDAGSPNADRTLDFSGFDLDSAYMGLNDASAPDVTYGLSVDALGADDMALAFHDSSDVAHGMTSAAKMTETDVYGYVTKLNNNNGGLAVVGATEQVNAVELTGLSAVENSTKSSSGGGHVHLRAFSKAGAGITAPSADANVFDISSGNSAVYIVDADGDSWQSGKIHLVEISEPSNAPSNEAYFYVKDNGSGKSQGCIRFASGASQCFATEP